MRQVEFLATQIHQNVFASPWHGGPELMEALAGVKAAAAAQRPPMNAHSIWEIALHLSNWGAAFISWIDGKEAVWLPAEQDWPVITNVSDEAWEEAKRQVESDHLDLIMAVRKMPASQLEKIVSGKDYSFEAMLTGVAQHVAYHTGQIVFLKKLVDR